jgi:hypothetical protein
MKQTVMIPGEMIKKYSCYPEEIYWSNMIDGPGLG